MKRTIKNRIVFSGLWITLLFFCLFVVFAIGGCYHASYKGTSGYQAGGFRTGSPKEEILASADAESELALSKAKAHAIRVQAESEAYERVTYSDTYRQCFETYGWRCSYYGFYGYGYGYGGLTSLPYAYTLAGMEAVESWRKSQPESRRELSPSSSSPLGQTPRSRLGQATETRTKKPSRPAVRGFGDRLNKVEQGLEATDQRAKKALRQSGDALRHSAKTRDALIETRKQILP